MVTLGILFLTSFILALKAAVVAVLVIMGISILTSFMSELRETLVAKLVMSVILSSLSLILALYASFQQHNFYLHHLVYLNQLIS